MAIHSNSPIISLLNEVIQQLNVKHYEMRNNWIMVIPEKACDYKHHLNTYNIKKDKNNHTAILDLIKILKKREEGRTND